MVAAAAAVRRAIAPRSMERGCKADSWLNITRCCWQRRRTEVICYRASEKRLPYHPHRNRRDFEAQRSDDHGDDRRNFDMDTTRLNIRRLRHRARHSWEFVGRRRGNYCEQCVDVDFYYYATILFPSLSVKSSVPRSRVKEFYNNGGEFRKP
ncbi:hypothetical protein F2P81_006743 [Scophthalmus maximus]|uniref:Uncharacterized protein n=1 Tax=Scophthalmus maximus TaxID=52904 RepID=A0A6A4T6Q2_SCOMX|nr:hypothetical protein F2P81_006743 [Scophthalmus maximus]